MRLTIITGLSGAGRTTALRALEDLGFFCADNIPPALIPSFAQLCLSQPVPMKDVAVVADMRMGDMFDDIYGAIDELRTMELQLEILFLDASDAVIVSRFKQTRRTHPVSGSGNILSGIAVERDKMQKIKEMADTVIDSTTYSPRMLAQWLGEKYTGSRDPRFQISIITFGYKRGIPLDADLVFDMRFLPNPFYREDLRHHSGLFEEVKNYVLSFDAAHYFLDHIVELVNYLCPCYISQDKKQLVIGVGCTGGMHRSVVTGEELFRRFQESGQHQVTIEHRDLNLERASIEKRFSDKQGE